VAAGKSLENWLCFVKKDIALRGLGAGLLQPALLEAHRALYEMAAMAGPRWVFNSVSPVAVARVANKL
jgi:hypothetical protein